MLSDLTDGMVFARTFSKRRPMPLDTRGFDFFIVQGPRAFRVSPETQLIVRYHDMIPVLEPDTMGNRLVISWHHRAIRENRESYFVCNSDPTRRDLTSVHPDLRERSTTIPYMLSDAYYPDHNPAMARSIVGQRRSRASGGSGRLVEQDLRYIMGVSTLEPRKNFQGLIRAFCQVKSSPAVQRVAPNLKLLIVGSPGWRYQPILAELGKLIKRGEAIHLEGVSAAELRVLYTHASALVFPSHAEGFGFPPLEAMSCGTPVIASDIPAHRWVLSDAALFCNHLEVASIAAAIERLLAADDSGARRASLIEAGFKRAAYFSLERCGMEWAELLSSLRQAKSATTQRAVVMGRVPVATARVA